MTRLASADFQGHQWELCGSHHALESLSDTQRLRLHCLFRSHPSGYSTVWQPIPQSAHARLYTQGIRAALQDTTLGAWAKLVQTRVPHLRYCFHPMLQLLRGISHQYKWFLSTPPPGTLIYAMVHVYMPCVYVGKSTLPLLQRLRKHSTTATTCAEDSSFHELLHPTDLHEWTPVPLQSTLDTIVACFLEPDW